MAGENMSKKSRLPMTIANFQHPILIKAGLQAVTWRQSIRTGRFNGLPSHLTTL
jgi:hypothetical protein